jgi:hypothetical protein
MDTEPKRINLAEKSFKLVWDTDVHVDNKANRVLSAMAFLTAAAAAIFAKVYSSGSTISETQGKLDQILAPYINQANAPVFNNLAQSIQQPHVTLFGFNWALFAFSCYVFFILSGVVLYLAALGPSLNIPTKYITKREEDEAKHPASLLFYNKIAKMDPGAWFEFWKKKQPSVLQDMMTQNYIYETALIAQKVQNKIDLMSWGSIFFKLAILFLFFLTSNIFSFSLILVRGFILLSTLSFTSLWLIEIVSRPPKEKDYWKLWPLLVILTCVLIILWLLKLA